MHKILTPTTDGLPSEPLEDAAHQARLEAAQDTANEVARRNTKIHDGIEVEVEPSHVFESEPFIGECGYDVTIRLRRVYSTCKDGEYGLIQGIIGQVKKMK